MEVATYRALGQVAREIGDRETASLASEIRSQEEATLRDVLEIIDELATEVIDAEVRDHGTYEAIAGSAGGTASSPAREPWPGYDKLTVAGVQARLGELDAERRAEVRAYERRNKNRRGVIAAGERELTPAS